ncbi:hypothetical protein [Rhodococcus opacus]|nr:hypothetical protein [Rhodococcus opacus]
MVAYVRLLPRLVAANPGHRRLARVVGGGRLRKADCAAALG